MTMKHALTTAALATVSLSASAASAQQSQQQLPQQPLPQQQIQPWPTLTRRPPPQRPTSDFLKPEYPLTSWDPLRFAIAVEGQTRWLQNDAAKRLAGTRSPTNVGLTAQVEVLRPTNLVGVRVDLGWATSSLSNAQPSTSNIERIETNVIVLGLSARYAVLPWLSPYARLSGGIGWDKVTISDGGASTSLHDRQRFSQGSAGAGIMFRSPGLRLWQSLSSPFLGAIAQIEGGYTIATSSDFALQSSPSTSGQSSIPTGTVALGSMDRSAPYVRFMAGLAF